MRPTPAVLLLQEQQQWEAKLRHLQDSNKQVVQANMG
jgi:hypothetical protein